VSPYRTHIGPADMVAMRLVRSPRPAQLLAKLLGGLFVVLVATMIFTPWVQTVLGTGRVVAYAPLDRQQSIEAPIEGRIVQWYVREGSRVKAGDPVAEIRDNDPLMMTRLEEERDAIAARLEAAKSRAVSIDQRIGSLSASRTSALAAAESRVKMAVQRVSAAGRAVAAAEAAERTTQANIDRQRDLEAKGLASRRAFELAELDHARAVTDLDRAHASLRGAESEELAIRSDLLKVGNDGTAVIDDARASLAAARAEIASATAEVARIEVRLARQAAQAVTAPRDGVILRLIANQGTELVKPGDSLAILVPDAEERAVELWIDGNDVPLVSEGSKVRLQFEGWPAVQFSGWPSVAVGTFGGQVALVDATDDGRGKFRVLIVPDPAEPWPTSRYLRQGGRANGWILLNQVRLGWELWRQFNGFPPSLSQSSDGGKAEKSGKGGS
jgi:membrane fusion protein, adhesin transport system